jgi:hypothetical protein
MMWRTCAIIRSAITYRLSFQEYGSYQATIRAVIETTDGVRLQVSFGDETAKIFLWQIVEDVLPQLEVERAFFR